MAARKLTADVAGTVWKIEVAEGAQVAAEDVLIILESMKMEIPVAAPGPGRVLRLLVAEGEMIAEGQALAEFEPG